MGHQTWRNMQDVVNMFALEDVGLLASYALQSQYAASEHVRMLGCQYQRNIDGSHDIDTFFDNVFNFETCSGTSLDIWAKRVGLEGRGYVDEDGNVLEWDEEDFRLLIRYKAMANISSEDSARINYLLSQFFETTVFVYDRQDMTIRINVIGYLSDRETNLLRNYGLFTRGAGVGYNIYQIDPEHVFGFDESELQPFNRAPFYPDIEILAG